MKNSTNIRCLHIPLLPILLAGMANALVATPGEIVPGWPQPVGDVLFAAPAIGPKGEIVAAAELGQESGTEGGAVRSFNPDGSVRWTFTEVGDWIDSSPTIAPDGTVYFGCWDGYLYALDGDSGALKWKFLVGNVITASPAVGPDGTIYIGAFDGILYAIGPDGSEKWTFDAEGALGPISASVVFNADASRLYFGTENGVFYCVNTSTGNRIWSYIVPIKFSVRAILAPAAVGNNETVYFTAENGILYALDKNGNELSYFSINTDENVPTEAFRSAPIIDENEIVYVAGQDGYLYAIGTENQFNILLQLWEVFVGDVFYCTPALTTDRRIIIAGYTWSVATGPTTNFTCVDVASQQILWQTNISGVNDSSSNIAPDGSIYIGAHDGNLYKLEGESALSWTGWPRFQATRRNTGLPAELLELELLDYFPRILRWEGGWNALADFGSGWIKECQLPWIGHRDHGLIYMGYAESGAACFFDPRLREWFAAMPGHPFLYYRMATGDWLYHDSGSSSATGRRFFDFQTSTWLEESQF